MADGTHRVTANVNDVMFERMKYWAEKKGITVNDLLRDAVDLYIAHQNRDYDLPTAEQQRLNQLIDGFQALSSNISSLERVVTSGFESLTSLTRGDNYLLDEDDGELSEDEYNDDFINDGFVDDIESIL